jgi:hypothetical protein
MMALGRRARRWKLCKHDSESSEFEAECAESIDISSISQHLYLLRLNAMPARQMPAPGAIASFFDVRTAYLRMRNVFSACQVGTAYLAALASLHSPITGHHPGDSSSSCRATRSCAQWLEAPASWHGPHCVGVKV